MSVRGATGILAAAGAGDRLGAGGPKALVELAGEALVVHAARALLRAESIAELIVVVGPSDVERVNEVLRSAGLAPACQVVAGGATRTESVRLGLAACRGQGLVAVHDAARALVSPVLVDRTVGALVDPWAAVAPAVAVVDTLKLVEEPSQRVLRTVDRRDLWAVQTPQVFERRTLERVHARVPGGSATDDLSLVEEAGERVRVVPGEARNFKITYPEDLELAAALLARAVAPVTEL